MAIKPTPGSKITTDDLANLTAAERKAVLYMRELKPYQRIEIRLVNDKYGRIAVTRDEKLREDFPVEMS